MLPGMNASVKITTGVSGTVPTVPAAAVVFDAGKSLVYTGYNEKPTPSQTLWRFRPACPMAAL